MSLLLKDELEDRIHRAADRLQPEIRAVFLAAVEELRQSIPIGELTDLLEQGKLLEAVNTISTIRLTEEQLQPMREALHSILASSATPTLAEFGMSFDAVNDSAVRWAERNAALLVSRVSEETMQGIRQAIVAAQTEGIPPRSQARMIEQMVGLTERDALAVSRFREGMIATGLRPAQIEDRAERMARRLLRRRATNIARTETIRASNMGVQLSWQAAIDQGLLPPRTLKIWIATGDDRTCPICSVLHGKVVGVSEPFSIQEKASSFTRVGDDFRVVETVPLKHPSIEMTPPAHPSCRCTLGIRIVR